MSKAEKCINFQNFIKLWKIVQNAWKNIPDDAQPLYFPKQIESWSYDPYLGKYLQKCKIGHLISPYHGIK